MNSTTKQHAPAGPLRRGLRRYAGLLALIAAASGALAGRHAFIPISCG